MMGYGLTGRVTSCLVGALLVPFLAQSGQAGSDDDQKGAVKGILVSEKTGKPIASATVRLFKFFSKTDNGKPFEMVQFAKDAPSITTAASGAFKFSDVPVTTLNSRLNKERQKYTLGLGPEGPTIKTSDGSLLLFEIKPADVVDLGRLRVKD